MVRGVHRWSIALVVAVTSLVGAAWPTQAGLISEREELQMGQDASRQIESRYPVSNDPDKTALVTRIGRRIAAVSSRPNLPWKFRVLDTPEVNALSVPGYVYVNTGLIDFARGDRDELAAVIAHEVAHTTRKHAVRQTEKALIGNLALQLLFKRDSRSLARTLAGMAANMALLGYGRKDELEADRHGAQYLRDAGFDPEGMVRFFERLRAKEGKESSGGLSRYFRTHPPTSERIRKLREYLSSEGQSAARAPAQPDRPRRLAWGPVRQATP